MFPTRLGGNGKSTDGHEDRPIALLRATFARWNPCCLIVIDGERFLGPITRIDLLSFLP